MMEQIETKGWRVFCHKAAENYYFESHEQMLSWLGKVSWECHVYDPAGHHVYTRSHTRLLIISEEVRNVYDNSGLQGRTRRGS